MLLLPLSMLSFLWVELNGMERKDDNVTVVVSLYVLRSQPNAVLRHAIHRGERARGRRMKMKDRSVLMMRG